MAQDQDKEARLKAAQEAVLEAEARVEALEAEKQALQDRQKALADELKAVTERLRKVTGQDLGYMGAGELGYANRKRNEAQQLADDLQLPVVRLQGNYSGDAWKEYVIEQNGAKRARLRQVGHMNSQDLPSPYKKVHPDDVHLLKCMAKP